jgi:hypothetical protein
LNATIQTRKLVANVAFGLFVITGCNRSTDEVEVTGIIKWNGAPLSNGMIVLQPQSPSQGPSGGKIENGIFRLRTRPGKMRVEIEAVRETSQRDSETGTKLGEMYIPARYNRKTELDANVRREGKNHFEFDLTN